MGKSLGSKGVPEVQKDWYGFDFYNYPPFGRSSVATAINFQDTIGRVKVMLQVEGEKGVKGVE